MAEANDTPNTGPQKNMNLKLAFAVDEIVKMHVSTLLKKIKDRESKEVISNWAKDSLVPEVSNVCLSILQRKDRSHARNRIIVSIPKVEEPTLQVIQNKVHRIVDPDFNIDEDVCLGVERIVPFGNKEDKSMFYNFRVSLPPKETTSVVKDEPIIKTLFESLKKGNNKEVEKWSFASETPYYMRGHRRALNELGYAVRHATKTRNKLATRVRLNVKENIHELFVKNTGQTDSQWVRLTDNLNLVGKSIQERIKSINANHFYLREESKEIGKWYKKASENGQKGNPSEARPRFISEGSS